MANQPTRSQSAAAEAVPRAESATRTVDIGALVLQQLQDRLAAIEAEDAKAEGREPEPIDVRSELAQSKTIRYMITVDGMQWRRGKPAPNMKSAAYNIFAMFRAGDDESPVRVYLIPTKVSGDEEPRLLCYEMARAKIDVICDEFLDPESFASTVVDEYLRSMGFDPDDEPEDEGEGEGEGEDETSGDASGGSAASANGFGAALNGTQDADGLEE